MDAIILKLRKKFEKLNIQSRILSVAALFLGFYFLWGVLVEQTLVQLNEKFSSKRNDLRMSLADIDQSLNEAANAVKSNPGLELTKRLEDNKKESLFLDQAIREQTEKMVTSKQMNTVLGYIAEENEGLRLIKIENSPAKKLENKNQDSTEHKENHVNIFEHSISMELEGGYFAILAFIKDLEKRKLNIVWDQIDYEVRAYPLANVKLTIHTLNLDEGLLGV